MSHRIRPHFYTTAQVRLHDKPSDLWMVVYNKVYDISKFVDSHPGGAEVMIDCAGVDATEAFEDVGHSSDALLMLAPYFVGDLDPREHIYYPNKPSITQQNTILAHDTSIRKDNGSFKLLMKKVTLVFMTLLAVAALMLYYYTQKFKWSSHNI